MVMTEKGLSYESVVMARTRADFVERRRQNNPKNARARVSWPLRRLDTLTSSRGCCFFASEHMALSLSLQHIDFYDGGLRGAAGAEKVCIRPLETPRLRLRALYPDALALLAYYLGLTRPRTESFLHSHHFESQPARRRRRDGASCRYLRSSQERTPDISFARVRPQQVRKRFEMSNVQRLCRSLQLRTGYRMSVSAPSR